MEDRIVTEHGRINRGAPAEPSILRAAPFGTMSAAHGSAPEEMSEVVRVDELKSLALDARSSDDASFLAARPGPCLLLIGPKRTNLRDAVVVPVGSVEAGLTTLGRNPENDIVAPWPSISRRHAVLVSGADGTFLIDRGSSNGTFLATERLLPDVPRQLREGDEIVFGTDLHAIFLTSRGLLAAVRRINAAA